MRTNLFLPALVLVAGIAVAQPKPLTDYSGFQDPPLFTRMPGFFLPHSSSIQESQFDAFDFVVQKGKTTANERVEGRKIRYSYYFDPSTGQAPPSSLQVQRNFQNAVTKIGGKILYAENGYYFRTTLVVAKEGKETWAQVSTQGSAQANRYEIMIVEREAMKQDIVANADAMKGGLIENGHVEVPGIFFDFNQAQIKPESQPAIHEITKLLRENAAMRVWVVGHTDNVGTAEANVKLSNARAQAVAVAIAQAGIDPKRLAAHGAGPYAPVSSNATEDGRARNRRVELVAQP